LGRSEVAPLHGDREDISSVSRVNVTFVVTGGDSKTLKLKVPVGASSRTNMLALFTL